MIEIDESTEFGARVAAHLRDDVAIWMTTVTPKGSPLPSPVWFHWGGGDSVIMFSQPGARQRNIEANPRVSLNFAGDGRGGDIVVLAGRATFEAPPRGSPRSLRREVRRAHDADRPDAGAVRARATPSRSRSS